MSIKDKDFIVDEYGNAFISLQLTAGLCGVSNLDVANFFKGDVDFNVGISSQQLVKVLRYFANKGNKSAIDLLTSFSNEGANGFIYNGARYKRNSGYDPMMTIDNPEYGISYSIADLMYRRALIGIMSLLLGVVTGAVILAIIGEFLK